MDEVSSQNLGQLPIPAVEGFKRKLADLSEELADTVAEVNFLVKRLERESVSVNSTEELKLVLIKEKSDAIEIFYKTADRIMNRLKAHLAQEDVIPFNEHFDRIQKNTLNADLYEMEAIQELNGFLQQALKNSNLLELGQKSHVKEIMTRYKI